MPNKKCWDCSAPGKVRGDGHNCPTPGSGKHDPQRNGNNNRGRRDGGQGKHTQQRGPPGGKAGGKSGPGRGLSKPCVVDHSQMPPRSDPNARAAYCAQEWHACTAQAQQQDAQQSAGSAPLPPESWAVPPPPPAYGAPPSGAGQAQASYYHPQQRPVPDAAVMHSRLVPSPLHGAHRLHGKLMRVSPFPG